MVTASASNAASLDPSTIHAVLAGLRSMHAGAHWHWGPDTDPFEICLGAILVQNTSWSNVELALEQLRSAGALDIAGLSALAPDRLEALLRPSGQYRQKARKVRAFLDLVEQTGGLDALLALPAAELRARLLATWGIGPETADCIILYAARQPALVIDAYTARIITRLGFGPGEAAPYDAWQRLFVDALPRDAALWAEYHALLVIHARDICRKRAPRCEACTFRPGCRFAANVPAS